MTAFSSDSELHVRKFNLEDEQEVVEYEAILNDETCEIERDEFVYDRGGHPLITI